MPSPDITLDLHFPKAGIDRSQPFGKQPNRPVANGEYARTTPVAINVRCFEPATNRTRGGSRPGLKKYIPVQVSGKKFIVQHLNTITTVRPGGSVQTSQSGRVVSLVTVVEGNVSVVNPGDTTWTAAINGTSPLALPPLNFSGLIRSAANSQKLWFADGINSYYYDPAINTVKNWTASAGTLPVDEDGNRPTLIENWRGRIIQAGLLKDPQNIFMSRQGDPTNWDYFPLSPGPADAVAGNLSDSFGLIGDVITCLIPYNDDTLVVGCDHEIHILRGDPGAGGQVDLVTRAIGMAFGLPWCVDPSGTIYFFSNRTGVFSMVPGQPPQRISDAIQQTLQQIDTGKFGVCMGWDDRFQGLHVFVTELSGPAPTTHFYYDQRNQAWFTDVFEDENMNPLVCTVFDGNLPTDRVLLIGSWDGYVRAIDPDAVDDDGVEINSEVWIGPLLSKNLDDVTLKALQAVLAQGSGPLTYSIHIGATAELALNSEAVDSGEWELGRNLSSRVKWADHAIYVKLTASNPWAMESIRAITSIHGKIRQRGR